MRVLKPYASCESYSFTCRQFLYNVINISVGYFRRRHDGKWGKYYNLRGDVHTFCTGPPRVHTGNGYHEGNLNPSTKSSLGDKYDSVGNGPCEIESFSIENDKRMPEIDQITRRKGRWRHGDHLKRHQNDIALAISNANRKGINLNHCE